MPANSMIERIRAEAPPIWMLPARRRFLGMVATELAGSRVKGLLFDDTSQPARWTGAPTKTIGGLEHLSSTRRQIDLLAATQRAAEVLGQEPSRFGHDAERWQHTAAELEQLVSLMRANNEGEELNG